MPKGETITELFPSRDSICSYSLDHSISSQQLQPGIQNDLSRNMLCPPKDSTSSKIWLSCLLSHMRAQSKNRLKPSSYSRITIRLQGNRRDQPRGSLTLSNSTAQCCASSWKADGSQFRHRHKHKACTLAGWLLEGRSAENHLLWLGLVPREQGNIKNISPWGRICLDSFQGLSTQEGRTAPSRERGLTSSLSSTSTSPLASSSISLWMLRTASKLSFSSSLWHRGLSIRQNSVQEKQETILLGAATQPLLPTCLSVLSF